jgi:hypothetical protein
VASGHVPRKAQVACPRRDVNTYEREFIQVIGEFTQKVATFVTSFPNFKCINCQSAFPQTSATRFMTAKSLPDTEVATGAAGPEPNTRSPSVSIVRTDTWPFQVFDYSDFIPTLFCIPA